MPDYNNLRSLKDVSSQGMPNNLSGLARSYGEPQDTGEIKFSSFRTGSTRPKNALKPQVPEGNRGFSGGAVGTFDPQAVNTTQETQMVDTPMGSVSMRDVAFAGMPEGMGTVARGMLGGLQETFGPNAVTGMYGSPSRAQFSSPQAQSQMAQAQLENNMAQNGPFGMGIFGRKNSLTPQAFQGAQPTPVSKGFMSGQQVQMDFQQENPDLFGQAMGEVASGRAGEGGRGTNGGMGGGVGDVGAGNPGGTGVL